MTELKESRWVKVHEPGQASTSTAKENVMDISIGEKECRADVTYTVPSYRKAAYWTLKYLEAADAQTLLSKIAETVTKIASENKEILAENQNWGLHISKMNDGVYDVKLTWVPSEPVMKKQKPARKNTKKASAKKASTKKTTTAKKTNTKKTV